MTDPFDACRVAYEQGQRDALAEAVQRVGALAVLLVNVRLDFYDPDDYQQAVLLSEVIAAIKGDQP